MDRKVRWVRVPAGGSESATTIRDTNDNVKLEANISRRRGGWPDDKGVKTVDLQKRIGQIHSLRCMY